MSDMDALIAKVEEGTIPRHDLDAFIPWRGLDALTNDSLDAYNGSLDAAKRLHDALLPGWAWGRWSNGHMWVTDDTDDADRFITSAGYHQDNPARAWLLAILRAVKAKAE